MLKEYEKLQSCAVGEKTSKVLMTTIYSCFLGHGNQVIPDEAG